MSTPSDADFPVLTDVIAEGVQQPPSGGSQIDAMNIKVTHVEVEHPFDDAQASTPAPAAAAAIDLQQIEHMLSERLIAELSVHVPVLVEAALREHLPRAMGARLQAELLTALTNALPSAAQTAAGELSATVAYEVGGLLEQRLQDEVRRAVADEIARLSTPD